MPTKLPEGTPCARCGVAPRLPGRSYCSGCNTTHTYNYRERSQGRMCTRCGQAPAVYTSSLCSECIRVSKASPQ
jgi:hypothetical protein